MREPQVVRLEDTERVSFGPLSHYQPIIGDEEGSTPLRTGIQTAQPGYAAPVHSHPYLEVLHILDGTAEAWIDGQEDRAVLLRKGDTIALPPDTPHAFRVVEQHGGSSDLLTRVGDFVAGLKAPLRRES